MSKLQDRYSRYKQQFSNIRRYYEKPVVASSLAVVLTLFLVSFFLIFALRPTLIRITELRNEIAESEEILEKLEKKSEALAQASALWSRLVNKQKYLQASIPIAPEYRIFVKEMEILALQNEVVYVSGGFGDALVSSQVLFPYTLDKNMGPYDISFSTRLKGTYPNLVKFVEALSGVDRIASINNVSFSYEEGAGGEGEGDGISLAIGGAVHYFAQTGQLENVLGLDK